MKKFMGVIGVLVLGGALMAAPKTVKKAGEEVLSPGRYSAATASANLRLMRL